MIRTILTPIDGSVHARMALDLSTDLAAKYDAQLVLLHVVTHDDNIPKELYDEAERELMEAEGDSGTAAPACLARRRSRMCARAPLLVLQALLFGQRMQTFGSKTRHGSNRGPVLQRGQSTRRQIAGTGEQGTQCLVGPF